MKLMIVSSSQRVSSQSAKVANYLKQVSKQFEQITNIELCQYQLPFWDGSSDTKQTADSAWPMLNKHIQQADAFVLITPE